VPSVCILSLFTLCSSKQILLFCDTIFGCFLLEHPGLLAITLGAGSSSHEIMEESHPQLCRVLQAWSDSAKMISALDCLAVITFVGATDLTETELSLKAMWDVIHPKSGSNVSFSIYLLSCFTSSCWMQLHPIFKDV